MPADRQFEESAESDLRPGGFVLMHDSEAITLAVSVDGGSRFERRPAGVCFKRRRRY
jgi:hypothetical protein